MARISTLLAASLAITLALSCGSSPPPERPMLYAHDEPSDRASSTRLVVVVVLDQLASWVLDRYVRELDESGALRTGIARGAFHRRVVYPYANTYTAPGHAAIATGTPPSVNGVVGNEVWSAERGKTVRVCDDGEHAVLGRENAFASPAVLAADTVADSLRRASLETGRVVSLSMKDRSAILLGGREPQLALWYDKELPGFTTSRYYDDALPSWVVEWQRAHPISAALGPWQPLDPERYARLLGPDDSPGEGSWLGLGRAFPHDASRASDPHEAFLATPASAEHLLALAREAVVRMDLGADDAPDLLAVSISTTDYVGHVFGPESWEYLDNLIRVDRALAAFFEELSRERGPISVLITSDHGVAPLPERSAAAGAPSGRIYDDEIAPLVDTAIDRALGPGDWVAAYVQPFVYFTADANEPSRRPRAVLAAIAALAALPSVATAVDARAAPSLVNDADPIRRAIALGIHPDRPGDVFVAPARNFVVDERLPEGAGTSHGTPWEYDREVPVIFWGPGVRRLETTEPQRQERVASTIAALLRAPPPESAPREVLAGIEPPAPRPR